MKPSLNTFVSLDGVMQGPGGPEADERRLRARRLGGAVRRRGHGGASSSRSGSPTRAPGRVMFQKLAYFGTVRGIETGRT